MSGHKKTTVSISQKEYQRLHEAEIKLRFLKQSSKKEKDKIKNESVNALWDNFDEIASRQNKFDDLINSFGDEIKNIEAGTCNAIINYQQDISDQLKDYAGDLWQNTNAIIQTNNLRFEKEIERQHLQNLHQINLIENQIEAFQTDQNRKFEIAVEWLNNAKEITRFIFQNYDHDKFYPSNLNQIVSKIEVAQKNIEHGMPEAAITIAQNAYLDLSNLRISLENKQHEWFILEQSVLEEIKSISQSAIENRTLPGMDLNGDPLDFEIDIDYWSGRKLSRFIGNLQGLLNNLQNQQIDFSIEFLQELREKDIPKFRMDLENIIKSARLNALNSQLRINIADLVIRALEEQGFALKRSNYQKDDMRNEFNACVENIEGNLVEIQVKPNPIEICENELFIHSSDDGIRTEHELQQRSIEISKSLQKFGLRVGALQQIPELAQRSRQSIERRSIHGRYKPSKIADHYEQAR